MRESVETLRLRQSVPIAVILTLTAGATYFVGVGWLGYFLTLIAGALVGLAVKSFGPQLVESVVFDGPIETTLGTDAAMLSKTWTVFVPRQIPDNFHSLKGAPHLEARAWFVGQGAFDASPSLLHLTLVNRSEATIILRGMSASVESRIPLDEGTYIYSPSAGDSSSIGVSLDLDEELPHAKHEDGSPYFSGNSVVLSRDEARVFSISATTHRSIVEWRLVLKLVHRGKNLSLVVNSDKEPLRTAPPCTGQPEYVWAWFEQPPRLLKHDEVLKS